jgi:hypothetical protein
VRERGGREGEREGERERERERERDLGLRWLVTIVKRSVSDGTSDKPKPKILIVLLIS